MITHLHIVYSSERAEFINRFCNKSHKPSTLATKKQCTIRVEQLHNQLWRRLRRAQSAVASSSDASTATLTVTRPRNTEKCLCRLTPKRRRCGLVWACVPRAQHRTHWCRCSGEARGACGAWQARSFFSSAPRQRRLFCSPFAMGSSFVRLALHICECCQSADM